MTKMIEGKVSKNKKYFIFNINSTGVTASLVSFDEKENKPRIEYSSSENLPLRENVVIDDFKKETGNLLRKTCLDLTNYLNITEGIFNIEKAFVFLSPPWVRRSIQTVIDERIEPFEVKEDELEYFLAGAGRAMDGEELLSAEIFSVKANGYDVFLNDLIGKKISRLEISLMDGYFKKEDKEYLETIIKNEFSFLKVNFSAFLPVFLRKVKELYDIRDDFVFLDFTGEVLDLGFFKDMNIVFLQTLEFGKNHIVREIYKRKLAKSLAEAEYLLILYLRKEIDSGLGAKIASLIIDLAEEINQRIEESFSPFSQRLYFQKAFVLSSGLINHLIEGLLPFEKVYYLGKSYLKNEILSDDEYFDNFMAMEADFLYKKFL